jgi:hypothetical protein
MKHPWPTSLIFQVVLHNIHLIELKSFSMIRVRICKGIQIRAEEVGKCLELLLLQSKSIRFEVYPRI